MRKTEKLKRVRLAVDYTLLTPQVQKELHRVGFSKADVIQGKALAAR